MRVPMSQRLVRCWLPCVATAIVLGACGGGGGGGSDGPDTPPPPPPATAQPTPLPAGLVLSGPHSPAHQVGEDIRFGHNATDPAGKLRYAWSFGDGSSSTAASPTHQFTKPGTYKVSLAVTNESGETRQATLDVVAADIALVQGLLCSGPSQTGWCWQQPLPQGDAISDHAFVDAATAYAVGDHGTVLKTVDGGKAWEHLDTGTDVALQKAVFLDARTGVVAGSNGLLLRTTDAGKSWASTQLPLATDASMLRSLGGQTLLVGSSSPSQAVISTDAGATWRPYNEQTSAATCEYSDAFKPVSETEVVCLGYAWGRGMQLQRSSDGGTSWTALPLPPVQEGWSRSVVSWDAAAGGFLVMLVSESSWGRDGGYQERRRLFGTTDAGGHWQRTDLSTGAGYLAVSFADAQNGLLSCRAGASLSECQSRRTTDGGAHWNTVQAPPLPASGYQDYVLRQSGPSLLVAENGQHEIQLSTDQGNHWTPFAASGAQSALGDVWFFNAREGIATATQSGTVRRTVDGGKTWTDRSLPAGTSPGGLQFSVDGQAGWMIGGWGQLYRSTDRGQNWSLPLDAFPGLSKPPIAGFHFVDKLNGWLVSPYGLANGTHLYRSSDGGSSWVAVPRIRQSLNSVHFGDAAHGVAVGDQGQALVTSDGGATWNARPTGVVTHLRKVRFVDATLVVALGDEGVIIRSTDGGQRWTRAAVANSAARLNDLRFVNTQVGHAVGANGTVLRTADGGKTWLPLPTPTGRALNGVFFVDAETGWVVGDNGAIMATAFGGD